MAMKLALVQELVLVGATKSRKPQLALGVMGQKLPSENYYSRIDKSTANSESQSVQDVRQVVGGGIGSQPAARDTGLDSTPNLLGVQLIDRHFGYCVLPAVPRMRPFKENPLVGFLRHDRGGRSDTLVWTPIVCAWQTVSPGCRFQNQDFKTMRAHWNPLGFNRNGGIKATQNLRQFLKGLIRDSLPDDGTVWPNPDQHLSAATVHEGAKSLACPRKLSGALLELKLFGFATLNEREQFLVCHCRKFY
jgi:hypothetical protein